MAIPFSDIVTVTPGVVSAAGSPSAQSGVILTQSSSVPYGSVVSFTSAAAVGAFFGLSSTEYQMATVYFNGPDNSSVKPGIIYFAPFAAAAIAGWLRSGVGLTLAAVNALSAGTLTVTIDGTARTTASLTPSGWASLSAAATAIAGALVTAGATGVTCVWDSNIKAFVITSGTTGILSSVTYGSGTLAIGLLLTQATSAVQSPGAVADTPNTAMANVIANTTNWAGFTTTFEPVTATKLLFGAWVNTQSKKYFYAAWDTDANAIVTNTSTTFGYQVGALNYDAVLPIGVHAAWVIAAGTTALIAVQNVAAFALGYAASINYNTPNGRAAIAFKSQLGLQTTVGDKASKDALKSNGYSYYGYYGEGATMDSWFYDGAVTGTFKWLDSFVNQIHYSSLLRVTGVNFLRVLNAAPYNQKGYAALKQALINGAIDSPTNQGCMKQFGALQAGVTLSPTQIIAINTGAGNDQAASIVVQEGYYLQVLDPGATVRAQRGSPVIMFWYTDGGAIQSLSIPIYDVI